MKLPTMKKSDMFVPGKYTQFRKGDLYRDPRIQQKIGENDFLIIDSKVEDYEFLAKYLGGKLANYPCEEYNMFTTGTDKNGTPMIGLYWVNEEMDTLKKALILCHNGAEDKVVSIVDEHCLDEGVSRSWEKDEAGDTNYNSKSVSVERLTPKNLRG